MLAPCKIESNTQLKLISSENLIGYLVNAEYLVLKDEKTSQSLKDILGYFFFVDWL